MANAEQKPESKTPLIILIAELGTKLGVQRINELPGCWECQVDTLWWFAINGHTEPMKARSSTGASSSESGFDVEPFHTYVEFNGWPAGVIGPPGGGGCFAAGAAANEDAFADALEAAITKATA